MNDRVVVLILAIPFKLYHFDWVKSAENVAIAQFGNFQSESFVDEKDGRS